MKIICEYFSKRMIVAAGVLLLIVIVSFLPARLAAQESAVAGEKTAHPNMKDNQTSPPVPESLSGPQKSEAAARAEALRSSRPAANDLFSRSTLPPVPNEIAPARFEASVYEVQVPQARIDDLDALALEARATTPQSLIKTLGEFGETKILYRIDQPVNLYVESIVLKSSEPLRNPDREPSQPVDPAVSTRFRIGGAYMQTGLTVNISANKLQQPDHGEGVGVLQVNFQLTGLAGVESAPDVKSARNMEVTLNQSSVLKFGKPTVLFNVSNPRGAENAQPVVYVICYVFKEIKP